MDTEVRYDREGRSLIEAAAWVRLIHDGGSGDGSSMPVRMLNTQIARALEEYAKRRRGEGADLDAARIEEDVQLALAHLRTIVGPEGGS